MMTISEGEKEFALIVLTQDGTIVDAHASCQESLGWARENLAGRDIGEILPAHRGLLISGILRAEDQREEGGEDPSFSMRIVAQRMDQTSIRARLMVCPFPGTDCWTAAFYEAPPEEIPAEIAGMVKDKSEPAPGFDPDMETDKAGPFPTDSELNDELLGAPLDEALFHKMPEEQLRAQAEESTGECNMEANDDALQGDEPEPFEIFTRAETPGHSEEDGEAHPAEAFEPHAVAAPEVEEAGPEHREEEAVAGSEDERRQHRLLQQRVIALTSKIASLHLELSERLNDEAHAQETINSLEEQLRDARKALGKTAGDRTPGKNAGGAELEKTRILNKALEEELAACKSANEALQRNQSEAEKQLALVNEELKKVREALAEESGRRQDLERKLTANAEAERRSTLEICRLESALRAKELELKRAEVARAQGSPKR